MKAGYRRKEEQLDLFEEPEKPVRVMPVADMGELEARIQRNVIGARLVQFGLMRFPGDTLYELRGLVTSAFHHQLLSLGGMEGAW